MKLPKLFYGQYREVKPRLGKIVTQIRRGQAWIPLVEAEGFLDIADTPGLILIHGPSPNLGSTEHFQAWLLWQLLLEKEGSVHTATIQRIFEESLTTAWGTLGLVARHNHVWLIPRNRFRPFLQAVRTYWHEFDAVGPRYTYGESWGTTLWALPCSIKYVLGNLGIPIETLQSPLPPGGIAELIERTEEHLH